MQVTRELFGRLLMKITISYSCILKNVVYVFRFNVQKVRVVFVSFLFFICCVIIKLYED